MDRGGDADHLFQSDSGVDSGRIPVPAGIDSAEHIVSHRAADPGLTRIPVHPGHHRPQKTHE